MPANSENISDSDLLRCAAKGDESAFAVLYRRNQGAVFRFALHMSGRSEIAEEVVQEVFLSLISQPKQYRPERGPLEAFLIGMARNKVRRHLLARRVNAALDPRREEAGEGSDPFENCAKKHELRVLGAAILGLPPRYREVVALCELEEMEYAEVAQLLGCPVGTVRSRLHRARRILTMKMRDREGCPV